jgi:predicted nucleotide-binding protein
MNEPLSLGTRSSALDARGRVIESRWYREDGWHVWRERTSKPFGHIRIEAVRALFRGLAAFSTIHEWRGEVLYVRSIGCDGTVQLEEGYLTTRLHFDIWGPANFVPFLKQRILSEVAAAVMEVAGSNYYGSKDVFIIHGHNETARTNLKLLLQGLGLNPIVLADTNDGGMTIIEKFEYYASACSFAFALMTPDDTVAGEEGKPALWRPRQNVLLEIGWFMARLGRTRVIMLSHGDLEMPSDLHGILYLAFGDNVMEVAPQITSHLREAGLV